MSEFALRLTKDLVAALGEVTGIEPTASGPIGVLSAYVDALAKEYGLSESLNLDVDPMERTQQVPSVMETVRHYFGAGEHELDADTVRSRLYDTVVALAADPSVRRLLNRNRPLTEHMVLYLAQVYWNLEATPERPKLPIKPAIGLDIPVPGIRADFATMTWTARVNQRANYKSTGQSFRTQGARLAVLVAKGLATGVAPAPFTPGHELSLRPTRDAEDPMEITLKSLVERAWKRGDYHDAVDLASSYFAIIRRRADANPFDVESALAGAYLLKGSASIRPNGEGGFEVSEAAIADLEAAIASYTTLSELDPQSDAHISALVDAHMALWLAYHGSSRVDDLIRAAHKGVSISERWAAAQPCNAERQRTYSTMLMGLSAALDAAERFEEAGAATSRALAITEQLVAAEPSEPAHQATLVTLLQCLSRQRRAAGRFEDAVHAASRAVTICEIAGAAQTENQEQLALSLSLLCDALTEAGRFDEAIAAAERSVTIHESQVAAEPVSDEHRLSLVWTLVLLGSLLWKADRIEAVPPILRRATEISMKLAEKEPEAPEIHRLVVSSLSFLVLALDELGRVEEAQAVDEVLWKFEDK